MCEILTTDASGVGNMIWLVLPSRRIGRYNLLAGKRSPAVNPRHKPSFALAPMKKLTRNILGIVVIGLVLHAADLATRDCRIAPYVYDDCMWMWLRARLGLPASRFLRMAVLECVGIALALALYLTFRCVFPRRKTPPVQDDPTSLDRPQIPVD